jgi:hypothetical protein
MSMLAKEGLEKQILQLAHWKPQTESQLPTSATSKK